MLKVVIKTELIHQRLSRNWLGWREGTHTLEITFRGSKTELMQKLKEELEKEIKKVAQKYGSALPILETGNKKRDRKNCKTLKAYSLVLCSFRYCRSLKTVLF